MQILSELKRRNVFRAVIGYVVVAWLILQVIDVLSDILELPAWPSQLILLALIVGLPIVILISWLYELTPDGFTRDSNASASDSAKTYITKQKMDRAIIAVLAIAVAFLVANSFLLPQLVVRKNTDTIISVAVLPFVNMSSDPETEFFSDGLSEELLNVLAQINNFRVPGRTSSFAFKNKNVDIREIGVLLNVTNILEGSVRRQGDDIRITAQLNEAKTGSQIWSSTFDRKFSDIFAIQDEIATKVSIALKQTLSNEDRQTIDKNSTQNPDAFQSFLLGKHYLDLRTPDSYKKALAAFQSATEVDPSYARSWAGQALAYRALLRAGLIDADKASKLGRTALRRAQDIDEFDYWVQYVKASWAETRESRVAALERAIESNPNDPSAYISLAWTHDTFIQGSPRRTELLRMAYERDPLSLTAVEQYAIQLMNVGEDEYALRLLSGLRSFNPDWVGTYQTMARIMEGKGKIGIAASELRMLQKMQPQLQWLPFWLAKYHIVWGDYEAAQSFLNLVRDAPRFHKKYLLYKASLAARNGKFDEANRIALGLGEVKKDAFLGIKLAQLSLLTNNPEVASADADEFFESHPENDFLDHHLTAAVAYHRVGRLADATARARWVISQADLAESNGMVHWWWPQCRSVANAVLGNTDAALNDLEIAIELGYLGMPITSTDHVFPQFSLFYKTIEDNLRYQSLVRLVDEKIREGKRYFESTEELNVAVEN